VAILTTIHPPTTTPFMTPVITIIVVVPGPVGDGRGAENAKCNPGSDPTIATSGLMNKRLLSLRGLDACDAADLGVGGALNSQGEKRSGGDGGEFHHGSGLPRWIHCAPDLVTRKRGISFARGKMPDATAQRCSAGNRLHRCSVQPMRFR
jgi:hypothetical protein